MAIVIVVCNEKRLRFPLMEAKTQNANYIAKVLGNRKKMITRQIQREKKASIEKSNKSITMFIVVACNYLT